MSERLKKQVAIVTGGSAGIGKAITSRFLAEGASVVACAPNAGALEAAIREMNGPAERGLAVTCDVSVETEVRRLIDLTRDHYGRLDILVNNAGVFASGTTLEHLSEQEWQRTFDIDAKGPWYCCKHGIPLMRRTGGGSIIMISSISAHIGQRKQGCYNAAKAAQEAMMKCMALDLAPDRIRVNSICPGWICTDTNRETLNEMRQAPDRAIPPANLSYNDVLKLHPIGRLGVPDDVAWAAVYLASAESAWVTGSSLFVDGGYTCQ